LQLPASVRQPGIQRTRTAEHFFGEEDSVTVAPSKLVNRASIDLASALPEAATDERAKRVRPQGERSESISATLA
jgi:hypothetical protein